VPVFTEPIPGDFSGYTINWRYDLISKVYEMIEMGECISLIGVGTVGKSHFIRRVTSSDIMSHYLSRSPTNDLTPDQILFVPIDPNLLLTPLPESPPSWSGFELILTRLYRQLRNYSEELRTKFQEIYAELGLEPEDQVAATRQLHRAIDVIFENTPYKKVILIFDEFNRLFDRMDENFFLNLRGIRDSGLRYKLLFMTTTRVELAQLGYDALSNETYNKSEKQEIIASLEHKHSVAEPFLELFRSPIYMRPAQNNDLIELTTSLNARITRTSLDFRLGNFIEEQTGGHAGLIRTCLQVINNLLKGGWTQADLIDKKQQLTQYILGNASLQRESEILLLSCSPEEIAVLEKIIQINHTGSVFNEQHEVYVRNYEDVRRLFEKSLVSRVSNSSNLEVSPNLFAQYLRRRTAQPSKAKPTTVKQPSNPRENPLKPPKPDDLPPGYNQ